MKIPRQGIEEYRKLVKRKYSLDMSYAEAEEGFRDLLSLFQAIYRPTQRILMETALPKNIFSGKLRVRRQ